MTVAQLIAELQQLPQALPVRMRITYFTVINLEDGQSTSVEEDTEDVDAVRNEANHVMLA